MKHVLVTIIAILLILATYKSYSLFTTYKALKIYKEDLAEINKINYGLFNLQLWKQQALNVFENRIGEFEISPKAYGQVEIEMEKYLHSINRKYIESGKIFEDIFSDAEKNGKVNKVLLKLIKENTKPQIKLLKIPQYIPGMAVQLAKELKKQEPQLRDIMRAELKNILKDSDPKSYNDPRIQVYHKYNTEQLEDTNALLSHRIETEEMVVKNMVKWIYMLLIAAFLFSLLAVKILGITTTITLITLDSVILLILGVNLPMIDIEALLNAFTINVMGSDIGFEKQYLYYQSKSIIDVTETLIRGNGLDLKIVGWMVLCFSVIFPFIKLILSGLYLYSNRIRSQKLVRNVIFYLGKWSMADVFVVALFMAYIGFYGIISSQLNSIARNEGGFAIETINHSKLSPGALFFTTYCIFSIIIGIMINKRVETE